MARPAAQASIFDRYDTHAILTRYADVALAALIVLIIGLMLVPLPTFLIDVLLTVNITLGLAILLTSLYIAEPVRLSSFPTILLISTMFRLSLSIATTRLILADAYAGEVIETFGTFVTRGNIIVGAVVFLIITIVQFLVIAKGSERISEVAARFTLDAMPGKQMAIDADLRAGAFDLETARRKRRALARESQFYGSMDGAMKFVKGDVIAGLIITAINIVGGLVIGVTMMEMEIAEAAEVYTKLTIGDGLVVQISALLVSTSAGMVTTRVVGAEEDEQSNLGFEISSQLLDQPKALLIAASFAFLAGTFTPLPTIPFFIVAGSLFTGAFGIFVTRRRGAARAAAAEAEAEAGASGDISLAASPTPVVLELSPELTELIDRDQGVAFMEKIGHLRRELYATLGMRFPGVRMRGDQPIGANAWQLKIFDVPLFHGEIPPDHGFVQDPPSRFVGLEAVATKDPVTGREASFVPLKDAAQVAQFASELRSPEDYLVIQLGVALRRHAADFLGIQETQILLDEAGQAIPALVKEVVPKLVPLTSLTEVLQRLVQEGVSIRDFRAILQSLARWGQVEKDPATLAEYVRSDMKQQISFAFARGRELTVYLLDPQIESAIRSAIQRTAQGSYLALDPDTARKIMASARKSLGNLPSTASRPVILTAVDVRRYLKKLVELDLPQVVVLSYQEISPLLTVQPVGRISLGR